MNGARQAIVLSVVSPAHNEAENLPELLRQITAAIDPLGISYEVIIVDDGSTDDTAAVLTALLAQHPPLRVLQLLGTPRGRGLGQSAAFHAGFRAARGEQIAVLDADLQNDPADLPMMIERLAREDVDLVQGDRSADRRDTLVRRVTSRVGRFFRRWLLGDRVRDTGCSLRVMRRAVALALPLEFRGMHRFIPISAIHLGYRVVEVPVHHRSRVAGRAKYGIWNRAVPGLIDCFAVRWMRARRRTVQSRELARPDDADASPDPRPSARQQEAVS